MDTVILALRVVVGLGAVFGALWFLHRFITKRQHGGVGRERQIAVVARQALGAKAGVAVVDAGGRRYLLGVTEHAVTVLDTLGEAGAGTASRPEVETTQPVTVTRFEQELRTVMITTGDLPVFVPGRPEAPLALTGPVSMSAWDRDTAPSDPRIRGRAAAESIDERIAAAPTPAAPASRRALREAEQRRAQAARGPLAGSVLSPGTWRQTVDALKRPR